MNFKLFANAINKKFLELSASGTQQNDLYVKVDNRPYKITF